MEKWFKLAFDLAKSANMTKTFFSMKIQDGVTEKPQNFIWISILLLRVQKIPLEKVKEKKILYFKAPFFKVSCLLPILQTLFCIHISEFENSKKHSVYTRRSVKKLHDHISTFCKL
jgi:hypothetical protein